MFRRLHPLFEEDGAIGTESGVDTTPAAEVNTQVDDSQTGVDVKDAADPEKQNNYEKAFAKRLAAKEAEWEAKNAEKYKDYDDLKKTTDYFQQRHGYADLMTMKEDIELAELQDRAAKENVSPETQKRIEVLEAKAAEGDELKQKQQEDQRVATYFKTLEDFTKDKGVDSKELNQFMIDNEMPYKPDDMNKSFNLALKAFQADEAIAKLETAKKDAVNEYLESKKAPRVEGAPGSASVQAVDTRKMTTDQLNRHVLERFKAINTPQ